jgi:esterase
MILHAVERGDGAPLVLLHGLFGSAANFGVVQRRLAARARVIALDLRNHGASGHADAMDYPTMAADVLETLGARDALPCTLLGHSMGGKVAMALALAAPEAVARLVVADIAPVRSPPRLRATAAAMLAMPLSPALTRAAADAALAEAVPEPVMRAFLLQNLRFGPLPAWRIGLAEIAAALPAIEDWPDLGLPPWPGPALFLTGGRSDYVADADRPAIRTLFPVARFVALKNAGHWLHADDPAGFVGVIEAVLGR